MNVPSYEFLAFVAAVALVINVSGAAAWRRGVLLVANLAFLSTFSRDPVQLAPFAGLLVAGFSGMKLMETGRNRAAFVATLVLLVAAFCWLKQYAFVPPALDLHFAYLTVGMSYVFFRVLHLVIDAYQDALPERIGPLAYVNYTLSFTSLVSGPIQSYLEYRRSESEAPPPLDRAAAAGALERIVVGFFKVAVLSPLLYAAHGSAVAAVSGAQTAPERVASLALVLAAFPLYLYANFSGYTDVVIGAARFLRLELPENFSRPFGSRGFIEFWGRWHMTLSNWLKTYVYSPLLLALMRRYPSRRVEPYLGVLAYFVTFFLVGAWHGQTTNFLIFGLLQGVGVSTNKLYQIETIRRIGRKRYTALCAEPAYAAVSRGLTVTYFAFTLLWFWMSAGQVTAFVAHAGVVWFALALLAVVLASSAVLAAVDLAARAPGWAAAAAGSRYARAAWYTALVFVTVSVTVVLNAPAPHVVYKGF